MLEMSKGVWGARDVKEGLRRPGRPHSQFEPYTITPTSQRHDLRGVLVFCTMTAPVARVDGYQAGVG